MKLDAFKAEKKRLLDRQQDVRACAGRILDAWGYSLESRKLGEAFEDPNQPGRYTIDRELAVYIAALADRRAVLTLPEYRTRRAATQKEGEVVVSKENRHGRAMGITSNQNVFSFSVMIEDANVVTTDEVGKPRNFMLQDLDGTWHDGWRHIKIMPKTEAEKKLFARTNEVSFDYFIHPNRWSSFYSRAFLLAKIAIERLKDQDRFLKAEQKRIRAACDIAPPTYAKSHKVGAEKKELFWAFNAVVEQVQVSDEGVVSSPLEFSGEYTPYPTTTEGLKEATLLRNRVDALLKKLRFHARATEYAFWKHAVLKSMPVDDALAYLKGETEKGVRQPSWAPGHWETGYKEKPKAKTFWARLNREAEGVSLRWRCWKKSERVAA